MISFDIAGHLRVKQRLELIQLAPAKRRRLLSGIARKVRVNSRKRIREQKGLDGKSWAPRKGASRRKLLRYFSQKMIAKSTSQTAIIGFGNRWAGAAAKAQQEGMSSRVTAGSVKAKKGQSDYQGPVTRSQAKALKQEGFKARKASGKGYKKVTVKWITENLTQGQAGIILRSMRNTTPKNSWAIELPERAFLGATEKEVSGMVQTIFENTIKA